MSIARPRERLGRVRAGLGAMVIAAALTPASRADVLLDEVHLMGLATVAAPAEFAFTEPVAEALTVTLTDFKTPAAFGSLQIAVTLGDALVGTGTVDTSSRP